MAASSVEAADSMEAATSAVGSSPMAEGMPVKMVPAIIAAADEDIVVRSVVAIIRSRIRARIAVIVVWTAVA